ncbi:carbohydrate-binding family 9-like protein [Mucilaginibacter mallensis]
MPQPHFLAWNNIESEHPNFHLSDFFGKALFLPQE